MKGRSMSVDEENRTEEQYKTSIEGNGYMGEARHSEDV